MLLFYNVKSLRTADNHLSYSSAQTSSWSLLTGAISANNLHRRINQSINQSIKLNPFSQLLLIGLMSFFTSSSKREPTLDNARFEKSYAHALNVIRRTAKVHPRDSALLELLVMSEQFIDGNDYAKAQTLLNQAQEKDPENVEGLISQCWSSRAPFVHFEY
jgi:hypothetical protein